MASGDVKMAVLGNIHMYIRVIEVSDFKSDFKFLLLSSLPCIVARSSKGPLPSCYKVFECKDYSAKKTDTCVPYNSQ